MVIYCGKETRIAQNNRPPINKIGKTDKEINTLSKLLFGLMLILTLLIYISSGTNFHEGWSIFIFRVFILLSAIIPISLKVNLDFAKL